MSSAERTVNCSLCHFAWSYLSGSFCALSSLLFTSSLKGLRFLNGPGSSSPLDLTHVDPNADPYVWKLLFPSTS